jgi:hypothetical protein
MAAINRKKPMTGVNTIDPKKYPQNPNRYLAPNRAITRLPRSHVTIMR